MHPLGVEPIKNEIKNYLKSMFVRGVGYASVPQVGAVTGDLATQPASTDAHRRRRLPDQTRRPERPQDQPILRLHFVLSCEVQGEADPSVRLIHPWCFVKM